MGLNPLDIAGDILDKVGEKLVAAVEGIIREIVKLLERPVSAIKSTLDSVMSGIGNIPDTIIRVVQSGITAVEGGFSFMADKISDGVDVVARMLDALKAAAFAAVNNVWTFFEDVGTKIASTLIGAFAAITHFITDQLAKMSRAMTFAFSEVKQGIETAFQFVMDGWQEWTKAIIAGISWAVDSLGEVLESLFMEILDELRKALHIDEDSLTAMMVLIIKAQSKASERMLQETLTGLHGGSQ